MHDAEIDLAPEWGGCPGLRRVAMRQKPAR